MKYIRYATAEQPINKQILHMERHIHDKDVIGCVQNNIIFWNEDGVGQWFWTDDDIRQMNLAGEKLLVHNTAKQTLGNQKKEVDNYWKAANALLTTVKKGAKAKRLAKQYEEYTYNLRRIHAHFVTTTAHVTHAVENSLKELLGNADPHKSEEYYQILTTPTEDDILSQELMEWRKLLDNPIKENIIDHAKNYSILLANVFSETDALQWADKRIKRASKKEIDEEIQKSKKRKSQIKKYQDKIISNLNIPEIEKLAWFIQNGGLTRLLIKACWNGEGYHLLPFYEKMAEKAGCSVKDLQMFYTYKDILNMLENNQNISKTELENRKKYFLLHFVNRKIEEYSGGEALDKKKELLDPHLPNKDTQSFTGTIANKGRVVGKARVVRVDNPNKLSALAETFQKDDILVTGMTNPTMMVLVNKVKGIITDEGGAACHAAIISREFGLPCIVGCSVATLILKDGDLIELDANKGLKGTVRRINEKEFLERK